MAKSDLPEHLRHATWWRSLARATRERDLGSMSACVSGIHTCSTSFVVVSARPPTVTE
jgi:hypothetical protein